MKMKYQEWAKTPYAKTTARNSDGDMARLLNTYGAKERQWTEHTGPSGRPAVTLRFNLRGKTYQIAVESLDVDRATHEELVRQAKRVVYWTLKPMLELSVVFGPPERLLLAFVETEQGTTVYEEIQPHMGRLSQAALGSVASHSMRSLPSPDEARK